MQRSVYEANVMPRPAKPAQHNAAWWDTRLATRRRDTLPTRALELGKVCRAGFAGRGTTSVAVHRTGILAVRPRPETQSRVGLLAAEPSQLARGEQPAQGRPGRRYELLELDRDATALLEIDREPFRRSGQHQGGESR